MQFLKANIAGLASLLNEIQTELAKRIQTKENKMIRCNLLKLILLV